MPRTRKKRHGLTGRRKTTAHKNAIREAQRRRFAAIREALGRVSTDTSTEVRS